MTDRTPRALVVGYRSLEHGQRRNIIGRVDGATYRRTWDLATAADAVARRLNGLAQRLIGRSPIPTTHFVNRFLDLELNDVTLCHLFNAVSYGRRPWVVTFETVVPRFPASLACHHGASPGFGQLEEERGIRHGLARLASDSCKRLIALSACNAAMQRGLLAHFPRYGRAIADKLVILHPPQPVLVSTYAEKQLALEGPLQFMFVGHDFFRKGGVEVLETFHRLRGAHGYRLELTIVSSLKVDTYGTRSGPQDVLKARAFIEQNASWIKHFERLPNAEVLALMKHAHVGLLPTYADTYGYSTLEFQASGCPVITTNVRALPEVNDNEKGWIIDVPKNRLGEAIYTTPADRRLSSERIREGLEKAVHEIVADRALVPRKADNAILSIARHHDPAAHAATLKRIYLEAIAG